MLLISGAVNYGGGSQRSIRFNRYCRGMVRAADNVLIVKGWHESGRERFPVPTNKKPEE